jgi:hypothetical protein
MSEFAKLFGNGDNQIVVFIQSDDEGKPEVRVFSQPPNLGVCSVAVGFLDTDEGWNLAKEMFGKVTEEWARNLTNEVLEKMGL